MSCLRWFRAAVVLLATPAVLRSQTAKLHRLPATPETVAWGYYWAGARPVLRIASGDIVEVETLLTNTPRPLIAAGVPEDQVESSLKAINEKVTDKGPGGHILTGPIFIEGAEPGDVLEVRILKVSLAIPYGYNGCSGFLREVCAEPRTRIIPLDRKRMRAELAGGIVVPLRPFFGSMGCLLYTSPSPRDGLLSRMPSSA